MIIDSVPIAYDVVDSIVWVLLVLDDIIYTIPYRIPSCEVGVYCIVFVSIENSAIHVWDIESSCICACYYAYQDE